MSFSEWYHDAQTYDRYNCMCEHFNPVTEVCMVYGTKDYPIQCAVYVCQIRRYSKFELKTIENLYKRFNLGKGVLSGSS